jgi:uncharacterized protein YabE (DUF348 family)
VTGPDRFSQDTEWFGPVSGTAVGLAERPRNPLDALTITTADVLDVLGPDADDLLASVDVDVDELIRLINAETAVMPAMIVPDSVEGPELVEALGKWKRRFLKSAVAAVLISITGGGASALAMDKSITVDVDGHATTVRTWESTVGEVLADEGIAIGEHDALSPSPQAKVGDGGKIVLDRGRQVRLSVDGEQKQGWVRSVTVGEAVRQLGVTADDAWTSVGRDAEVPLEGMSIEVKTVKTITLFDGAKEARQLRTTAVTVEELLATENLAIGQDDHVEQALDLRITSGAEVHISRTGVSVVNVAEPIAPPVEEIPDSTMTKGSEEVVDPGEAGEQVVTYRVTQKNGRETAREQLGTKVVKEPRAKKVKVGTKVAPDGAVWDRLVQCEASGNWHINNGNGYYGGLQFDAQTWAAYGGTQYAPLAHQASREQQIAVATKVRDARGGYSAWPHCSGQLGL